MRIRFNQDLYNVMLLMLLMSDADDDDDSNSLTGCIILVWIMRFCETEYINICPVCSSSRRESLLSGRSQYTERLLHAPCVGRERTLLPCVLLSRCPVGWTELGS